MKTGKQEVLIIPETIKTEFDSSFKNNPDSVHVFNCNGKNYTLKANKISRAYFPYDLRDCLLVKGFNGDENANKQLATIIRNTIYNDLLIFGGSDAEFRGPIVFEAFLNKSQDYTPLNLADDGEDSIYAHGTVSDVYMGYYCKMIKSIDGWEPYGYIGKKVKFQELDNYLYGDDGLFNPEYGIEVGTKAYNAMLEAYQQGKIVFKAYGEEEKD
ncbi:MAG: hypothetical protein ACJATI_001176 [Halioglobus sp.]|jgi:hypothetical protein